MSEMYEAACEIREPIAGLRDAVERIAELLGTPPASAAAAERLDRLEAILLDLYPDSCRRHGLGLPASRELRAEARDRAAEARDEPDNRRTSDG